MKKYLALLLTVAMCLSLLTGCGGSSTEGSSDGNSSSSDSTSSSSSESSGESDSTSTGTVRTTEDVEAAKAIDCSTPKIIFTHILPNAITPMIVSTTMGIGGTIMGAAGLSYLGLGIQPPIPEWGAMLTAAKDYWRAHPLLMLWPGLCIALFVLGIGHNFIQVHAPASSPLPDC